MTEPIKLPPLPLEDALKRAYYYTEAGEWRYPETCNEWDRWHAVAKVATLAVEAERKACAKLAESLPMQQEIDVRDQCAAAIRAREPK
jgi:hypothetical protein